MRTDVKGNYTLRGMVRAPVVKGFTSRQNIKGNKLKWEKTPQNIAFGGNEGTTAFISF